MKNLTGLVFLFGILAGCGPKDKGRQVNISGQAQGTYYAISYFSEDTISLKPKFDSLLNDFDRSMSLWVPESTLSRINRNETTQADTYLIDNFELARQVAEASDGYFDFTLGALIDAWGFGLRERESMTTEKIDSLKALTGYQRVSLANNHIQKENPGILLNFNAIAQGYAVDLLGRFLESKGIQNYIADIGGEIRAKGQKPGNQAWKVGIETPAESFDDERSLSYILEAKDLSVATSGNYRKYYEQDGLRYSHTINPRTARPVSHRLLSVTVVDTSTALADAWATAYMAMGLEKAKGFLQLHENQEALFIYSDEKNQHRVFMTEGLKSMVRAVDD